MSQVTYGPAGGGPYEELKVAVGAFYPQFGSSGPVTWVHYGTPSDPVMRSDTVMTWYDMDILISRPGIGGGTGDPSRAGCEAVPHYLVSGAQTVKVTLIEGPELAIQPSYALVKRGTTVRFTGRASNGAIAASPHSIYHSVAGSVAPQTVACGIWGANPCDITVWEAGELRMSAPLEGDWRSASATVQVYSTFALKADASSIQPGDTARFTPMVDGAPGVALRWIWRGADSTEVGDPCMAIVEHKCVYAPAGAGTMWAYTSAGADGDSASAGVTVRVPTLTLNTSKSSIPAPGDTVSFEAKGNGVLVVQGWTFTPDSPGAPPPVVAGNSWGACAPPIASCTNLVQTSGTVSVLATVDGVSLTRTAHLTIEQTEPDSARLANDSLLIRCTSPTPTRGDTVRCDAALESGSKFSVNAAFRVGGPSKFNTPIGDYGMLAADSTQWEIHGPALFTTVIGMAVTRSRDGRTFSKKATAFTVRRRSPVPFAFPPGPALVQMNGAFIPEGTWNDSTKQYEMLLGQFQIGLTPDEAVPLDPVRVDSGPNWGYGYLRTLPKPARPTVYYNRAADGVGPWAQDQRSTHVNMLDGQSVDPPPGKPRWCTQNDFPAIKAAILRHEGSNRDPGSHMEAIEAYWSDGHDGDGIFEALLFSADADENGIKRSVLDAWAKTKFFVSLITAEPIDRRDDPIRAERQGCSGFNWWDYPGVI